MKTIIPIPLLIVAAMLGLGACGTTSAPLPTPTAINPAEVGMTLFADKINAEATQANINMYFTATAQIVGATQTAQQVIVNAEATQQARNDAQATANQARKDEQATAEQRRADIVATQARKDIIATAEQSHVDAQNTQSALATSTWAAMTMTAIPPHATLTQMAINNQIELNTQAVARSGLELKQQQDTNVIQWLIPTLIAVLAAMAGAIFVFNYSQVREVKNDNGDIELIVFKNQKAIRPRLLPRPVLELGPGEVLDIDPQEQAEVTKRSQAIDALAAMPIAPTQAGVTNFNSTFAPKPEPRFGLLGEGDMPPAELINSDAIKAIEGDWKDINDK